jgi:arginine/serine-rich splicing factor 4/5/6
MARRLYLGRLPPDARSDDVSKFFEGYGRIIDCRVMTGSSDKKDPNNTRLNKPSSGFGFIEFESSKDAEDAVTNFNGKPFMGTNIVVEFAKESRPRRDNFDGDRGSHGPPRSRRPPGIRLIVSGISRDTSWQDLKDFGREAGSVSFADIDRDFPGNGILEYLNRDDADRAVKDLDGKDLRGRPVRVALDDTVGVIDN